MELRFEIPGKISGKGRPRFSTRGGKPRTFTPEKTRSAEAMVRVLAYEAMKGRGLLNGPVLVNVTIWQLVPKSWSNAAKLAATYATGRPDLDNIAKLITDSMNLIVYTDDAQIASLHVTRHYGTIEKTVVSVTELSGWSQRKAKAA